VAWSTCSLQHAHRPAGGGCTTIYSHVTAPPHGFFSFRDRINADVSLERKAAFATKATFEWVKARSWLKLYTIFGCDLISLICNFLCPPIKNCGAAETLPRFAACDIAASLSMP